MLESSEKFVELTRNEPYMILLVNIEHRLMLLYTCNSQRFLFRMHSVRAPGL